MNQPHMPLEGRRILVTGATGQVGRPIAEALNATNDVWAAARFRDETAKAELVALGIAVAPFRLGDAELADLPDVDYVIHCAADTMPATASDALRVNAEGTGWLMKRYRDVAGFFHMSSSSVYRELPDRSQPVTEDDLLGGFSGYAPHYAMSKLVSEGIVRFQSRELGLPTIMGRLNVAYGNHGHRGLPNLFHEFMKSGTPIDQVPGQPTYCSPIHEDDIAEQVSRLVQHAQVGAPAVNLGGDDPTTLEEIIAEIAALTGLSMSVTPADSVLWDSQILDASKRRELAGPCRVGWRDGIRRCLVAKGAIDG